MKAKIKYIFLLVLILNPNFVHLHSQINEGERVKSEQTGLIYLCLDNQLYKFENGFNMTNLFLLPENIRLISEAEIQKLPIVANLKNVYLAKAEDAAIYLVIDKKKRHISSPKAFDFYGFDWNKVIKMSNQTLWKIPTGNPIIINLDKLIEQPLPCGNQ
jgi:hypothetical protein